MEPEAAPHGCLEPLTYKKPFDSQLARPDVAEPFCRSSRAAEAALLAGKLSIDSGYPDAGLPPEEVRTTFRSPRPGHVQSRWTSRGERSSVTL